MAICLLVRHGHSEGNAAGVLSGRLPGVLLTERGREQVAALGATLQPVALVRVVSSPLERCMATADALVAGRDGLSVEADERLVECGYGAWTGRSLSELAKEPLWNAVQFHPGEVTFPPSPTYAAESMAGMAARVVAAVQDLDAQVTAQFGPGAVWAAVTHGDLVKSVVNHVVGARFEDVQRVNADPASVAVLRFTPQRPYLLGLNIDPARIAGVVAGHSGGQDAATPGGSTGTSAEAAG